MSIFIEALLSTVLIILFGGFVFGTIAIGLWLATKGKAAAGILVIVFSIYILFLIVACIERYK